MSDLHPNAMYRQFAELAETLKRSRPKEDDASAIVRKYRKEEANSARYRPLPLQVNPLQVLPASDKKQLIALLESKLGG